MERGKSYEKIKAEAFALLQKYICYYEAFHNCCIEYDFKYDKDNLVSEMYLKKMPSYQIMTVIFALNLSLHHSDKFLINGKINSFKYHVT